MALKLSIFGTPLAVRKGIPSPYVLTGKAAMRRAAMRRTVSWEASNEALNRLRKRWKEAALRAAIAMDGQKGWYLIGTTYVQTGPYSSARMNVFINKLLEMKDDGINCCSH